MIENHIVNGFTVFLQGGLDMSAREKSEKTQMVRNPNIFEQINHQSDKRVKMIYDRYRTGKSIIMDDLKYLWLKDPEGCEKIARSIVEGQTVKEPENKPNYLISIENGKKIVENTNDQQDYMDYKSGLETPIDTLKNVLDTITKVKLMIDNMSEKERMDILRNLNETPELQILTNKMKYWDDAFSDKMLIYTYDVEKEFDKLA